MTSDDTDRLGRLLARHQALHDPGREPRNALAWLPALRRWQALRLQRSFAGFLDEPRRAPAARFFLDEVYGDRDFSRRDADIARVIPMMRRLLPGKLLATMADAIELGALSHELDLDVAQVLQALAPDGGQLDVALYAQAYRRAGRAADRAWQIALIGRVGRGFGGALRMPGVASLLRLSRRPAKLAGLDALQGFLERGYGAFESLDDPAAFVAAIERDEDEVSRRLFAAHADPFGYGEGQGPQTRC